MLNYLNSTCFSEKHEDFLGILGALFFGLKQYIFKKQNRVNLKSVKTKFRQM